MHNEYLQEYSTLDCKAIYFLKRIEIWHTTRNKSTRTRDIFMVRRQTKYYNLANHSTEENYFMFKYLFTTKIPYSKKQH